MIAPLLLKGFQNYKIGFVKYHIICILTILAALQRGIYALRPMSRLTNWSLNANIKKMKDNSTKMMIQSIILTICGIFIYKVASCLLSNIMQNTVKK